MSNRRFSFSVEVDLVLLYAAVCLLFLLYREQQKTRAAAEAIHAEQVDPITIETEDQGESEEESDA
ncbi:hypothetical protein ACFQMA_09340 [Halosimplex aquaticum]|uniref:Uncharacterized protein n=1 Tax=Halosimplex aquaticum TaxID=3026162 RepID=A0ABD5Y2X5_9EURY|nr:hypothetical protein [Halosimplex aquaticum]